MRTVRITRVAAAFTLVVSAAMYAPSLLAACPPLDDYYPGNDRQWPQLLQRLAPLEPACLESAEYFALLGAGRLNSGQLVPALEALERALLLDPASGAAQADYAEALYFSGQLFPAMELNRRLLARADTPAQLREVLETRQQLWEGQTLRRGLVLDVGLGHDNNLNGGPSRSEITLTLSGEPVQLVLDQAFQPLSGAYANVRLTGLYQRITPDHSHDLLATVRTRNSEYPDSDLLQFDWRYSFSGQALDWRWGLTTGTSHLLWGGSPLYSVTEARFNVRPDRTGCVPQQELAVQHQRYHGQSVFSGIESSLSAGFECRPLDTGQVFGLEAGAINNSAIRENRPGDGRQGWKLRAWWESPLGPGVLSAQYSLASLQDGSGYNELLANNARRRVISRLLRVQYRQNLQPRLALLVNLNHQQQGSNLEPFQNDGTAFELGLSYSL